MIEFFCDGTLVEIIVVEFSFRFLTIYVYKFCFE